MALFDNFLELKKHNSALSGGGLDMANIQSFIDDAINYQLIPAVGFEQYSFLVGVKNTANYKEKRAIDLAQKAVTGFMISNFSDNGSVQINGAGIMVPKSTSMAPAIDKKLMQLRKSNTKSAFASLELLVNFLEDNKADFQLYAESEEHKENRSLLINTSAEFQRAGVQIGSDAQLYQTLRVYQGNAEETYIIPTLTEAIADGLKAKILAGTLTDVEKSLLKKIQKPLAAFTMAEAIPYQAISIDSTGIFELSETVGGISGNVENRRGATDRRLAAAMNAFMLRGEQELETLRKYMKANAVAIGYAVPGEVLLNDDANSNIYII